MWDVCGRPRRPVAGKGLRKYCVTAILLAWVMWEYTLTFPHGTKSETWRRVDDHYFQWTCKLASYWEARNLAHNNLHSRYLGWNTTQLDRRNGPSELHEFICFPDNVDPQQLHLWQ